MVIPETLERFKESLLTLDNLKNENRWLSVKDIVGKWLMHVVGLDPNTYPKLNETSLMAGLVNHTPTYLVPYKKIILIRLLKEAGDFATATYPPDGGFGWYRKSLNLLLISLSQKDLPVDYCDLLPTVDDLVLLMSSSPLPLNTLVLVMAEYERRQQFGRMRDIYKLALKNHPRIAKLACYGLGVFSRINKHNDAVLLEGGFPRADLLNFIANLRKKNAQGTRNKIE